MPIDYLLIGHVTQDLTPYGTLLGGTAYYSAVTAHQLGLRVGVVTRAAPELRKQIEDAVPGINLHLLPAEQTTTFENRYHGNDREQFVHYVAPPIALEDVPLAWRSAPIVHLAPLVSELEFGLGTHFPDSLVGLTPQGWLRAWDEHGRVRYAPLAKPEEQLAGVQVLVFSAEDVAHDPAAIRALIEAVPIAIVTRAAEGAVLYTRRDVVPSPARPAEVVDPTGAGDVFAAAFLTRLAESGDPVAATAFANVVASFSIEGLGTRAIPALSEVEAWLTAQTGQQL